MIRGISGGEKKRTAIGIELVMRPQIIFLDEPTSGLDSFAAQAVIRKLQGIATTDGCNVLCTIHQPSSEVFHTFQQAMLLYKGKALFCGAIPALSEGLRANDVGCPAEYNLADHAINLIQTTELEKLDQLAVRLAGEEHGATALATPPTADAISSTTAEGSMAARGSNAGAEKNGPAAGFFMQLYHLSRREGQAVWRNKPALIASIIFPVCC